eukprot:1600064-Prorocentrum_lima.AAC.1
MEIQLAAIHRRERVVQAGRGSGGGKTGKKGRGYGHGYFTSDAYPTDLDEGAYDDAFEDAVNDPTPVEDE